MLPQAPNICGIAATADRAIPSSRVYQVQRELFRRLKAAVLAR
jgi:hypothetical protein